MIEAGKVRGVSYLEVDAGREGQRIDNFLTAHLKGVPRSHIYRLLRTGQVRVNKGRIQPTYRLKQGDVVRVPPVSAAEAVPVRISADLLESLEHAVLYEDDGVMIVNKPAGLAVHGGSGLSHGLIEALRELRPKDPDITLVHRLDRDTSGCLLVAKDRRLLPALTEAFRRHEVEKRYLTLLRGRWKGGARTIRAALTRARLQSGERMVQADEEGREAETRFTPVRRLPGATLMEARIRTGRTHQIRVHAAELGHPVAGDEKYGDPTFNQVMRRYGLKRMFLHAHRLALRLGGERIEATAELPPTLARVVQSLVETPATDEGLTESRRRPGEKRRRAQRGG